MFETPTCPTSLTNLPEFSPQLAKITQKNGLQYSFHSGAGRRRQAPNPKGQCGHLCPTVKFGASLKLRPLRWVQGQGQQDLLILKASSIQDGALQL